MAAAIPIVTLTILPSLKSCPYPGEGEEVIQMQNHATMKVNKRSFYLGAPEGQTLILHLAKSQIFD